MNELYLRISLLWVVTIDGHNGQTSSSDFGICGIFNQQTPLGLGYEHNITQQHGPS